MERGGRPRRAVRSGCSTARARRSRPRPRSTGPAARRRRCSSCRPACPTAPTSWPGGSSRRTRIPCPARSRSASARPARSSSTPGARRTRPSARSTPSPAGSRSSGWRWRSAAPSWSSRCGPPAPRRTPARGLVWAGVGLLLAGSVVVLAHAGSIRVRRLDHRRLLRPLIQPRYALRPRARGADRARARVPGAAGARAAAPRRAVRRRADLHLDARRPLAHGGADLARRPRRQRAPAGDGDLVRRAAGRARLRPRRARRALLPVAVGCWAVLAVSGVYLAYRQTGELGALAAHALRPAAPGQDGRGARDPGARVLLAAGRHARHGPAGNRGRRDDPGRGDARRHRGARQRRTGPRRLCRSDRHDAQRLRRDGGRAQGQSRQAGRERHGRLPHAAQRGAAAGA